MFVAESRAIANALGDGALQTHHIGSTAIPGIHAKPIIDILLVVGDVADLDRRVAALEGLGYEGLGEYGIAGRRYFRKNNPAGERTHQIHAFAAGSPQIESHLVFRDFLRAHAELAERFSDLKRGLALAHPDSIERYSAGKDAFIREVIKLAAAWRSGV